ncbi:MULTISPECIES: SOS response-associated peptidase [Klebsiella]|uniref:SOS response-associated peptidase n=1 Tax=Klebsiella TaxID=570 RepID=UPI0007A5BD0C|nr:MULTISPECIES: SOS response-associated peptidase [Klebsiella]MCG5492490.1 SOS response-associated peptidase [Klebsiella variicola]MDZ0574893.1 SOS response-associated peptidase [Klebsiella variicola]QXA85997.1 SOS response-associated peptidase [Klebsiella quasipneumoniae]UDC16181.1 SOS response-associated peptidase [Klebsiella quasipneumoniae subsp. similipneumoniae]VGP59594.1 Putative SOS response-associated peptidase YedK [Klebsiella quasipneumoniae subsp. similipneumoniae]
MCGRFSQSMTREEYLSLLANEGDRNIAYDPEPIGRYNVAPGTRVLLLSERDEQLQLDPVHWGYAPGWWDKPPLINARVETAANSRMFKPLWQHDRAICFADGWFEWKREGDKKQPYFIYRKDGQPILMAAIGSTPFERGDEAEGFLIVTAAADKGLVDIHDRRPLVLVPDAAREWMKQDVSGKEAEEIAANGAVSADHFIWHPVTRAVGNVKNQGPELIEPVG